MPRPELNRLLFVEDEPDIRQIAQIALEDLGKFKVKFCENGSEALKCIEEFKPNLILLDVMMPVMDGIATLQAIQKNPLFNSIPVIFMTAKVQANEINEYIKLGAVDVIPKPFDPMTLAETIRSIWDKN